MPSLLKADSSGNSLGSIIHSIGAFNIIVSLLVFLVELRGLCPLGILYFIALPANLFFLKEVANGNKTAIMIQIIILASLVIVSSFLTALVIMFGPILLYDLLAPKGVPSSVISTILLSSHILPTIGFGPGFLVEPALLYISLQADFLHDPNWLKYGILVTGPTTLVLSIIFLAIIIVYWRSVKRGGLFE